MADFYFFHMDYLFSKKLPLEFYIIFYNFAYKTKKK